MNAQTKIIPASKPAPTTLKSSDLFGRETVLNIKHEDMMYTLRITRQGKLLLTK